MLELAKTDLFADNVNVPREVELLNDLGREPGEQADYNREQCSCPERQCAVDMLRRLIKCTTTSECRVYAGPEPNQHDTDYCDKEKKPVPSVLVHQDVGVDNEDGGTSDVNTHQLSAVEIMSRAAGESTCME